MTRLRARFKGDLHLVLACCWFVFGIHGAIRAFNLPWYSFGPNVAQSIAVLFFISVYANGMAHIVESTNRKVEEKQDSKLDALRPPRPPH